MKEITQKQQTVSHETSHKVKMRYWRSHETYDRFQKEIIQLADELKQAEQ